MTENHATMTLTLSFNVDEEYPTDALLAVKPRVTIAGQQIDPETVSVATDREAEDDADVSLTIPESAFPETQGDAELVIALPPADDLRTAGDVEWSKTSTTFTIEL